MVKLDSQNHELFPVDMDHSKISTFPTRSDPFFITIIETIKALLKDAEARPTRPMGALSWPTMATSVESIADSSCTLSSEECYTELNEPNKSFWDRHALL